MKLMIASDIHGSAKYCRELFEAFEREQADKLLLLGDLLYHGPRNDLPDEYNPKQVITILNEHKEKLMCVRGNCEAEVDQMVLEFPVLAEYMMLYIDGQVFYVTHGHHENPSQPPLLKKGEVLLNGHTHVPKCEEYENFTYMNPGSVSIPKEDSERGYMVYENGHMSWKNLMGNCYMEYDF